MNPLLGVAFAVALFWLFEALVFVCSYKFFSKT
jgi:hypothetical protein